MPTILKELFKIIYVITAFCAALFFGALKSVLVGPVAALIVITGNLGVILGLFPAHVAWAVYTLVKLLLLNPQLVLLFLCFYGFRTLNPMMICIQLSFILSLLTFFVSVDCTNKKMKLISKWVYDFSISHTKFFFLLDRIDRFDAPLKVAFLFALPALFGIWLGLSIAGSVLVGIGYGFIAPWVSSFEAFRLEDESNKFYHCIVDGTLGTIKGSCTVVRDFADLCYHSYPLYMKELRESPSSDEHQPLRFIHVPGCIFVGLMGLIVEIPLYTAIAIVKSPYMLFRGWQRLMHDLISREGPFLETACIPIAGLTILVWPIVVIGSIIMAIVSSIFVGLYGSVIVYQERSIKRGVAYVIAMVAEFDEYTNDCLHLREGSILPKPKYRKRKASHSTEFSVSSNHSVQGKRSGVTIETPAGILIPSLSTSRSVREVIREVGIMQVWGGMMKSCEMRGQELLDAKLINPSELYDWLKAKRGNESTLVGIGLPCFAFFHILVQSIKTGSDGLMLHDGLEINHVNRPRDRLMDWFFQPILVLKEQIKVIRLEEGEARYLEKLILFGSDSERMQAWDNGSLVPQDALRFAQIQGLSRRMLGLTRSVSKLPTYRRQFRQVVKSLVIYSIANDGATRSMSMRSVASIDSV